MNESEGLKFITLDVENFKSIEKKVVEINGRSLLITGKNGEGKSSLIQALLSGIDSKIQPSNTIKKGAKKASTKVVIAGVMNGKEENYVLEMFYTEANQSGRIILTNSLGEKVKSPKEVLKSIIGNISFDIFAFLKSKKGDQIKILKELSGVAPQINKLDFDRKAVFDDRQFLARTVKENEAVMNNHGMTPDEIDLYSTPIPLEPLQEVMNGISKKITTWTDVKNKTDKFKEDYEVVLPAIKSKELQAIKDNEVKVAKILEETELIRQSIIDTDAKITLSESNYTKGVAWLDKNEEPKAEIASQAITDAVSHNTQHEKVLSLAEKQKGLIADKQRLEKLNSDIEDIDAKKDKLIKNSKLPIKGLSFDEDNIYLDGLPVEEGQQNTAALIDMGVEISMALNPNLRAIFIHEGSLFDKESLSALIKKVEDRGYQLIVELVTEDEELEVKFTEHTPED